MSETVQRSAPLLPPDAGRDRPLFAVAAILVFLACLAALGAAGAWQASEGWTQQLTTEVTVQIFPGEDRDADADAQSAGERLATLPGVTGIDVRSRDQAEALLRPWLGSGGLPEDLPVPRLIAVTIDPENPPVEGAFAARLDGQGYEFVVDRHGNWAGAVERAAAAVRYFALGLVVLLTLAAAAVVAFAARASLAARWDVAEALHLVGARDSFIASLFQRRFFFLGLKAGLVGAIGAALSAWGLALVGGTAGTLFFLPSLELGWVAVAIPPFAALVSGLIAALAARSAVDTALKARWS
ncbi:cell division protein FtsX [Marinicauda pacifica]|uniref:cell division protein FtsX n=1 Tax=Marinicauda pacifica TaxID=1133559 RepID=UPI0035C7C52F